MEIIDFEALYFNNDLQTKQLAISEFPQLTLANKQSQLNDAIGEIDKNGYDKRTLNTNIFGVYNENLLKGVSVDDPELKKLLKNNVTKLAAAKANYTAKLIERCKADLHGVERSKEDYQKESKKVINRANSSQAAEYNTTVHRSRVVKQWERFEREKHLYPHFKWLRTRSATPREVHLSYVGRVWKLDDPFLLSNHPGCTWNCKCDGTNTDEPVTDNGSLTIVPASPGLEGNPYYTKEIFSIKHPYFSRVDKHIPNLGVLHNPDDIVYLDEVDNGIKYKLHYLAQKEFKEHNNVYLPYLNKAGYKDIRFLPQIDPKEPDLRMRYFGKIFSAKKCPDVNCDGLIVELKSVDPVKKIRRNIITHIGEAAQKADVVMIYTPKIQDFGNIAKSQFDKYSNLKRIIFVFNNDLFDFVR